MIFSGDSKLTALELAARVPDVDKVCRELKPEDKHGILLLKARTIQVFTQKKMICKKKDYDDALISA